MYWVILLTPWRRVRPTLLLSSLIKNRFILVALVSFAREL